MSGRAKHYVELTLHVLPNPVAPRANDHAPTHIAWFGQLGRTDDLLIPFRKIFIAPWTNRSFLCGRSRHCDNELSCRTRNDQRAFSRKDVESALRIARDQWFRAFCISTGEIDTADSSIPSVRPKSGAGKVEFRIENVFAVTARANAIVNDERQHDPARSFLAIRNVFAPTDAPSSIAADPVTGTALFSSIVPKL